MGYRWVNKYNNPIVAPKSLELDWLQARRQKIKAELVELKYLAMKSGQELKQLGKTRQSVQRSMQIRRIS